MAIALSELDNRSIHELSAISKAWDNHEVSIPIEPCYFLTRDESQRLKTETGRTFNGAYEPEDYSELFRDAITHPVTVYEATTPDIKTNLIQFPVSTTEPETEAAEIKLKNSTYTEAQIRALELKEAAELSEDYYPIIPNNL